MGIRFVGQSGMLLKKSLQKAGLDNQTCARHQQRFELDIQCSAFFLNFNNIFSIGHLYRADEQLIPYFANTQRHTNLK